MPASSEHLTTNALNYLIWRYLQESGFGNAAIELSKAWNRDPEKLPFAPRVQRKQLWALVQDGLQLDAIRAECTPHERRWSFGPDAGPQYSVQSGDPDNLLPYGTALHPPKVAALNGQNARDTDTSVPPSDTVVRRTPARRRKGTVTKEQRLAETMEADTNGMSNLSINATEGAISDAPSPVAEEPPPPPPPPQTKGPERGTQSERHQVLKPDATVVRVAPASSDTESNAELQIDHAAFSPAEPNALFLAGKNLARIYIVPTNTIFSPVPDSSPDFLALDVTGLAQKFNILACTWIAPLELAVLAVWEVFENEKNEQLGKGRIVQISKGNVSSQSFLTRTLANHTRDVLALRWNPPSRSLLCISFTEKSGIMRVWTDGLDEPPALLSTDFPLYDGQWINDAQFVVCGQGTVAIYEVVSTPDGAKIEHVDQRAHKDTTWNKCAYDPLTSTIAVLACDSADVALLESPSGFKPVAELTEQDKQQRDLGTTDRKLHHLQTSQLPTTLAFQPIPNPASLAPTDPRLLAVSFDDGHIVIYNARQQWQEVARLVLGMGKHAETCAWSGDGFLLAAAGGGRVVVWRAEDILAENGKGAHALPRAVWVAPEGSWGRRAARTAGETQKAVVNGTDSPPRIEEVGQAEKETNGVNGAENVDAMDVDKQEGVKEAEREEAKSESGSDEGGDRPETLVWDADGKKVIYTTGDQVAVINLRSS